jgi:hypothetical protein
VESRLKERLAAVADLWRLSATEQTGRFAALFVVKIAIALLIEFAGFCRDGQRTRFFCVLGRSLAKQRAVTAPSTSHGLSVVL